MLIFVRLIVEYASGRKHQGKENLLVTRNNYRLSEYYLGRSCIYYSAHGFSIKGFM